MTKRDVVKALDAIDWKDADLDIFYKIKEIVEDYIDNGEDRSLDSILDNYVDVEEANEHIKDMIDDGGLEGLENAKNALDYLYAFCGVYKYDEFGQLEDVDVSELRDEIVDALGIEEDEEEE